MGRNAAGESFLRGFLRHSRAAGFFVDVRDPAHVEGFASAARAAGHGTRRPARVAVVGEEGCAQGRMMR
jgi:hypothetical protein